jgi:hypothetical protein
MKADSSWLYIILSIVFVALSAFGNKDKKKATTSTKPLNDDYEPEAPASGRKWPKSLEDVLTEVLDMPKQPEVARERPQTPPRSVVPENPYNSYEEIGEEAQSLETIPEEIFTYEAPVTAKPEKTKPAEVQHVAPREEEAVPAFAFSNFDARQGIIYAEILNRKYF